MIPYYPHLSMQQIRGKCMTALNSIYTVWLSYLKSHSELLTPSFDPDRGLQTGLLAMCCDPKTSDCLQPAAVSATDVDSSKC
jgi:hypothetical protein